MSGSYWFLPAGLRLGMLWMLPRRWWAAMAALEWTMVLALGISPLNHESPVARVLSTVLPLSIYALTVHFMGRPDRGIASRAVIPKLLACGVVAAMFTSIALTAVDLNDDGRLPMSLTSLLISYSLGGFAGTIIVLPLVLMFSEQFGERRRPLGLLFAHGWVFAPVAIAWLLSNLEALQGPTYPLLLSLLPVFALAYLYGWRQGALAMAMLLPALHLTPREAQVLWDSGQLQLALAIAGCGSLLLGMSSEGQRIQNERLAGIIETVSLRSAQLTEAAHRISSLQEQERRRIGVELHDQIGQDMTAIATHLRLIEHKAIHPEVREGIVAIGRLVAGAHGHLREVINELHPAVIDRFGLSRALCGGPMADMLRLKDIEFECNITGPADSLPANVATTLYRICQEAVTNAAKHGCGGSVRITLAVFDGLTKGHLTLHIADDAGAIDVSRPGRGLQNIRDRAYSLGAEYGFDPYSGRPRHLLRLAIAHPLDPPDGSPAADAVGAHDGFHTTG